MNINNDYNLSDINLQIKTDLKIIEKTISSMSEIKGEVTDLRQGEITVRLEDNSSVSAKILNPENIKIGMTGSFKAVNDKPLLLELISTPKQNMKTDMLGDILGQLGFKVSSENIEKAETLMNNSFAVTKENFLKLNQAVSLTGDKKQAMVFMNNDIKMTAHNADTLKGIINNQNSLSKAINDIAVRITEMGNDEVFEKAINIVSGDKEFILDFIKEIAEKKPMQAKEELVEGFEDKPEEIIKNDVKRVNTNKTDNILKFIKKNIPEKSFEQIKNIIEKNNVDVEKTALKVIKKGFFKDEIKDIDIEEISKGIEKKTEALAELDTEIKEISQSLSDTKEFVAQLKESVYIQFPIVINNNETDAQLYVFRDKGKTEKQKKDSISALVALDTANLGHFEAYMIKRGNKVSCQFRIQDENVKKLIEENISILNDYLKDKNIVLAKYDFRFTDEPFTIGDKEPSKQGTVGGNFAFDMRT